MIAQLMPAAQVGGCPTAWTAIWRHLKGDLHCAPRDIAMLVVNGLAGAWPDLCHAMIAASIESGCFQTHFDLGLAVESLGGVL